MKQVELANRLGVSKAYISMVLSGKKKPSKRIAESLKMVNSLVNFEAESYDLKSVGLRSLRVQIPPSAPRFANGIANVCGDITQHDMTHLQTPDPTPNPTNRGSEKPIVASVGSILEEKNRTSAEYLGPASLLLGFGWPS